MSDIQSYYEKYKEGLDKISAAKPAVEGTVMCACDPGNNQTCDICKPAVEERPTGLDGIMAGLKEADEKYGAAVEDAPRDVDWRTWFCDAHRPIQSHAKGMCFVCNALKLMRTCEHGVEAGEHCSVCGTLSATPRTPLRELITKWRTPVASSTPGNEAVYNACADELEEALRTATPAGPTIREVCDPENYIAWLRFNGRTYVTCDSNGAGAFKVYRWRDRTSQP